MVQTNSAREFDHRLGSGVTPLKTGKIESIVSIESVTQKV
jgi:hypothetical protein